MILLDTCALLWLDSDRAAFSRKAMRTLGSYADALAVSPASFMEIGIKQRKGKLILPLPLRKWVETFRQRYRLTVIPVTDDIAITFNELPPVHHDPFVRLIIATAQTNKLAILTADSIFGKYPDVDVIW